MENEKFKSPKTNRYIYLYGPVYNDLIKNGYTEEFLLALPRIQYNKSLKSPIRTVKLTKSLKTKVNTKHSNKKNKTKNKFLIQSNQKNKNNKNNQNKNVINYFFILYVCNIINMVFHNLSFYVNCAFGLYKGIEYQIDNII